MQSSRTVGKMGDGALGDSDAQCAHHSQPAKPLPGFFCLGAGAGGLKGDAAAHHSTRKLTCCFRFLASTLVPIG